MGRSQGFYNNPHFWFSRSPKSGVPNLWGAAHYWAAGYWPLGWPVHSCVHVHTAPLTWSSQESRVFVAPFAWALLQVLWVFVASLMQVLQAFAAPFTQVLMVPFAWAMSVCTHIRVHAFTSQKTIPSSPHSHPEWLENSNLSDTYTVLLHHSQLAAVGCQFLFHRWLSMHLQ